MCQVLTHIHPLQVENCDSNSRLAVDEYDNGKLRLDRVRSAMMDRPISKKGNV